MPILVIIMYLLNTAFGFIVVFYERRNPAVTWAWLMVIAIVPFLGFLIYLVLGRDGRKHRSFSEKSKNDEKMLAAYLTKETDAFRKQQAKYVSKKNVMQMQGTEHMDDLVYLNFHAGKGAFSSDNIISLYHDGTSAFEALLKDISKAKKFIYIQYYIFRDDSTGKRLVAALAEKAAQGLEVRLLVDGMGNIFNKSSLYAPLIKAGGYLGIFLPPYFIRINFRNHRKIAVMDGNIGHIGGMNIGDEYLGLSKRFGYWRDTHLRLTGSGVHHLTLRFMMDWNFCVPKQKLRLKSHYFPRPGYLSGSGVRMQVVCSGPDTRYPSILYGYNKMITEANTSIFIQTPYFVPDDSMFVILKMAALSGLDVRIMIPANPDHPFVYWAAMFYLGGLLESGVKCYEYQHGFLHNKVIMIDSKICSVGTANMDVRSFNLNFESNAFIYDETITTELETAFINDIQHSRQLTLAKYRQRSKSTKIKESISRLLSPLL
ncbi:MAG: cardiolipin synthase [Firmicutes bacterium]|nr:cardiolipin synthase [Bacillota bacterium]